jgi:hypothetical protein
MEHLIPSYTGKQCQREAADCRAAPTAKFTRLEFSLKMVNTLDSVRNSFETFKRTGNGGKDAVPE